VVTSNVVAACFAALAGVIFLVFAAVHFRPRPTLIGGRTVALACVLAVLFPLFLEPIRELLRGLLLGEPYSWGALVRLGLFVVVTVGVAWYFRGWLFFNVDTRALGDLLRESCAALGVPCHEVGEVSDLSGAFGPSDSGAGRRFHVGPEERTLSVRLEPGSRYASLRVGPGQGRSASLGPRLAGQTLPWGDLPRLAPAGQEGTESPWAENLGRELRRRLSLQHTGRYYSRALIYLLIGLVCLGFALILFVPERLGLLPIPGLPSTPF
jgi:hypothetical protein